MSEPVPSNTLQAAFSQSLSSIVITDADFEGGGPHIILCNDTFIQMTGYTHDELIGQNPRILQGPKTDRSVIDRLRQCLHTGEFFHGRTVNYRKDGSPYFVEWNISAIRDKDGKICNYVSVQMNISAQIEAEMQRDVLAMALEKTKDCVMVTDESDCIVFVNKGFEQLSGYTRDEVIGHQPFFFISGGHGTVLKADVADSERAATTQVSEKPAKVADRPDNYAILKKRDGSVAYVITDVSSLELGGGLAVRQVCIGKDITEQVERGQRLEALAQTDPLTGLLNRLCADTLLQDAIDHARQEGVAVSVIMCDVDHFKRVNDTFGHAKGDIVLKGVAAVLEGGIRKGDACFRWGGEEFLIALPGHSQREASEVAERIREHAAELVHETVGQVTMSFGVAQWNQTETVQALIERADKALYEAKRSGRNRVCTAS